MINPVGSYATLFQFSEKIASLLPGGPVVARTVSLFITDQFVGFLIGAGLLSILYLTFVFISRSISAVFRRREG